MRDVTYGEDGADDCRPEEGLLVVDVDVEERYVDALQLVHVVLDVDVRPPQERRAHCSSQHVCYDDDVDADDAHERWH